MWVFAKTSLHTCSRLFQWRKGLKLSGESAVEKITLDGVRGLRTTLSATVHDVLYYMSPIYCQEIIDSVLYCSSLSSPLIVILCLAFGYRIQNSMNYHLLF